MSTGTVTRNFDEAFFTLALAEKDIRRALDSASELDVPMFVTRAAHEVYARALSSGLGDKNSVATLVAVEEAAGVDLPPGTPSAQQGESKP